MRLSLTLVGSFALALVASVSLAQNFNVDFGASGDAPSSTYGAAGQVGSWNDVNLLEPGVRVQLRGLDGVLTNVDIRGVGGTQILHFDNPATAGDDDALIDDMLIGFNDPLDVCLWIDHLENGFYEVTNYALTPDDPDLLSRVRVDYANEGPIFIGGAWDGAHRDGISYTRHYVEVTDNEIAFHAGEFGAVVQSGLNGVQVRLLTPSSTSTPGLEPTGPRIDSVLPNPGMTDQTIQFSLPQPMSNLRLDVVDATGRTVWSQVLRDLVAGSHAVVWDGRDRNGRTVAPSIYFVRMTSEVGAASGSLIRVR